jgi:Leucine-rich repeat (LRR) protein
MVWTRTATTGETKSISFSKSSPAGMIVNCGDGRGERTLPNSPFQCKYATGGSYQASIANPELITSNFSISYGNITAFWAGKATNISGLSIGYNEITTLPVGAFSKLPNLTRLVLNRNKITSLPAGVFDGLSGLNTLDLSNNQLTSLPAGIFSGLSNLSTLHFYYNQLTSLPAGIFDGLSNLINLY